jgi:hypothetical protein
VKIACNHSDPRAKPSGLDDMRLREKKSIAACRLDAHCLGSDAAQRTLNQICIKSSKAYI